MQIFFFLLVVMALVANLNTGPSRRADQINDQAASIAAQMIWYHNAAVLQCAPPNAACAAGPVTVTSRPGLANSPATMTYVNDFISVVDASGQMATTWKATGLSFAQSPLGLGGLVAAALRDSSDNSRYAGAWDAATQSVRGSSPAITVTATNGLPLVNNAPVLVSQTR